MLEVKRMYQRIRDLREDRDLTQKWYAPRQEDNKK